MVYGEPSERDRVKERHNLTSYLPSNHMVNTSKMEDSGIGTWTIQYGETRLPWSWACGGVSTIVLTRATKTPFTGTQMYTANTMAAQLNSWHVVTRVLVIPCRVSGETRGVASVGHVMHHLLEKNILPHNHDPICVRECHGNHAWCSSFRHNYYFFSRSWPWSWVVQQMPFYISLLWLTRRD